MLQHFHSEQVREVVGALKAGTPGIVSVFAGRIADTGVDPVADYERSTVYLSSKDGVELCGLVRAKPIIFIKRMS